MQYYAVGYGTLGRDLRRHPFPVRKRDYKLPMFMMQLVPEGTPPVNKAKMLSEKYVLFRDKLRSMGLKSGILIQCSIGHGYTLNSPSPFKKYVNLNDGKEETVCCPYDDDLCAHFKDAMKTLAQTEPDLLMLDDDFRLIFRGGNGCACPMHMARFNELAGTDLTREELFQILKKRQRRRIRENLRGNAKRIAYQSGDGNA